MSIANSKKSKIFSTCHLMGAFFLCVFGTRPTLGMAYLI
nr:MAG TPA: hypothetical protein [Caudoviricetes sp.]